MNPIFGKPAGGSGDIGPAALIQRLMGILHGNDPQKVTQLLAKQNPQFAQFMRSWWQRKMGLILNRSNKCSDCIEVGAPRCKINFRRLYVWTTCLSLTLLP